MRISPSAAEVGSSSIDLDALEMIYTTEEFIYCTIFSKEKKRSINTFLYTYVRVLVARM